MMGSNGGCSVPHVDTYAGLRHWLRAVGGLHAVFHRSIWRRIVQALTPSQCARVLDVGCGTGGLAIYLKRRGFHVVGADSSVTMLARAKSRAPSIDWVSADAAELPFRQEFDAVVIAFTLHEMAAEARSQVWKATLAAVRPGGRILVVDYDRPALPCLTSRLVSRLIDADERMFLRIHPLHYWNFREWIDNGGLTCWLNEKELSAWSITHFLGGSISMAEVPT